MPNMAFLAIGGLCAGAAWFLKKNAERAAQKALETPEVVAAPPAPPTELSWDDVRPVDLLAIEVGYKLVPLVDTAQGGDLVGRIKGVRRKLTQELGFLVPAVRIRDNLEFSPGVYRINLSGVPVGEGVIQPDRFLAINPGTVFGKISGIDTQDPAFGLEAVWIDPSQRDEAQTLGYTVVDPSTVIATHLSHVVQTHAHELLGHEEVTQMLQALGRSAPKLVEDLVPKLLPMSVVVRVMQGLLAERVPVRNMRTIVETLAEHAPRTQDPMALQAVVRVALGRQIVQDIAGLKDELPVITLEGDLEQLLQTTLGTAGGSGSPGLEPGLADRLQQRLAESARRQELLGEPAVLLVPPSLRQSLARFVRASVPGLQVLAWNEIPDNRKVRLVTSVGR